MKGGTSWCWTKARLTAHTWCCACSTVAVCNTETPDSLQPLSRAGWRRRITPRLLALSALSTVTPLSFRTLDSFAFIFWCRKPINIRRSIVRIVRPCFLYSYCMPCCVRSSTSVEESICALNRMKIFRSKHINSPALRAFYVSVILSGLRMHESPSTDWS